MRHDKQPISDGRMRRIKWEPSENHREIPKDRPGAAEKRERGSQFMWRKGKGKGRNVICNQTSKSRDANKEVPYDRLAPSQWRIAVVLPKGWRFVTLAAFSRCELPLSEAQHSTFSTVGSASTILPFPATSNSSLFWSIINQCIIYNENALSLVWPFLQTTAINAAFSRASHNFALESFVHCVHALKLFARDEECEIVRSVQTKSAACWALWVRTGALND